MTERVCRRDGVGGWGQGGGGAARGRRCCLLSCGLFENFSIRNPRMAKILPLGIQVPAAKGCQIDLLGGSKGVINFR